ncbi:hypothetical protein [Agrococcus lahaulensis]|nr:hypothetical protein [Agrococcus lahaulensis]
MATIGIIMPFVPFVARTDWGPKVVIMPVSIAACRAGSQTAAQCDEL